MARTMHASPCYPLEQTAAPSCKLRQGLATCSSAREHESGERTTNFYAERHKAQSHRGSELPREVVVKSTRVTQWTQSVMRSQRLRSYLRDLRSISLKFRPPPGHLRKGRGWARSWGLKLLLRPLSGEISGQRYSCWCAM
jgi:hypothetical protein